MKHKSLLVDAGNGTEVDWTLSSTDDGSTVALEVTDHWDEEGKRFGSVGVPLDDSELADFDDDDPGAYAGRLLDELAALLPEHLRPVDTVRDALQAGLVEWVCDARSAAAEAAGE